MENKTTAPFGSWKSSISAELVAGKTPRISEPTPHHYKGDDLFFWLQSCPEEKGRTTLMLKRKHELNRAPQNLLPRPISVSSKVHEYGGGSYCVYEDLVYFVLSDDQRIYSLNWTETSPEPKPVTPDTNGLKRFSDLNYCAALNCIVAVCETHSRHEDDAHVEPSNSIVAIKNGAIHTLHQGEDFYSNPRTTHCGTKICWLSWNHPAMPWNNTQLWVAQLEPELTLLHAKIVKGESKNQSIFQPMWHPSGELFCVTDTSDWWNIVRASIHSDQHQSNTTWHSVTSLEAEFATPQWVFGMKTYAFFGESTLFCSYTQNGQWHTATVENIFDAKPTLRECTQLNEQFTVFEGVCGHGDTIAMIAANAASLPTVQAWTNGNEKNQSVHALELAINTGDISTPKAFSFPSLNSNATVNKAHAFYYPPCNQNYCGPNDSNTRESSERPPVILLCHGGPTGATSTAFNPKIQYWTSRGFAVIDVNYRGSTGYGRRYRESLHDNWGIFDVEDMCAAKAYAVQQGWASDDKAIIKGSSAGGYTVLAALAFTDAFNAGVSLYGIGDLETLACDTHKFEARYLDTLIGPYPEQKDKYIKRSPIHYVDNIRCPLLVFQGMLDKVVPPNQAQNMVDKMRESGTSVTYITFANEGHGFRDAANIRQMLEAELTFYQTTFSLTQEKH